MATRKDTKKKERREEVSRQNNTGKKMKRRGIQGRRKYSPQKNQMGREKRGDIWGEGEIACVCFIGLVKWSKKQKTGESG
jgi:hypothetical protein